jgi:hypothetical protein
MKFYQTNSIEPTKGVSDSAAYAVLAAMAALIVDSTRSVL